MRAANKNNVSKKEGQQHEPHRHQRESSRHRRTHRHSRRTPRSQEGAHTPRYHRNEGAIRNATKPQRTQQPGQQRHARHPTTARVYNATTGKWENVDIHKLPAGTVLHSGTSSYYRTSDHILTHRVGPWVSDIGSTITSANLAAQIRLQYKGDNAYYTAITPTAMNTLSQ